MTRPVDRLRVENLDGEGVLENFTSATITNSLTEPAETAFELGDDGTWEGINRAVSPGSRYRVFVNGRPRLTGKVELLDAPFDASGGATVRFTVRSKLSDAWYQAADPNVRIKGASIKEYLLALYDNVGIFEDDFVFDAAAARDLMTGKQPGGGESPPDLEEIEEEHLRPNPPESVYMAADRALRRHGLMHWDSPDGRIVVSSPNDEQAPLYSLRAMVGPPGRANNILSAVRTKDWTEVASHVVVYGKSGGLQHATGKVRAVVEDEEVVSAGFFRPVIVIADTAKTQEMAEHAGRRERTARAKRKDAWRVTVDGLAFWNGGEAIPYGIDTTCEVVASVVGGPAGAYFVHRTTLERTPGNGDVATLEVVRRGVWDL